MDLSHSELILFLHMLLVSVNCCMGLVHRDIALCLGFFKPQVKSLWYQEWHKIEGGRDFVNNFFPPILYIAPNKEN